MESERLERLISRKLDGELSPEEELALDRHLMADTEARRLFDELSEVDDLSGRALRGVPQVAAERNGRTSKQAVAPCRRFPIHRGWFLIPGAVAAAWLATVLPFPGGQEGAIPREPPPYVATPSGSAMTQADRPAYPPAMRPISGNDVMSLAEWSRPRIEQKRDRDFIGIPVKDGSYLLLEVEWLQTIRQPADRLSRISFEDV